MSYEIERHPKTGEVQATGENQEEAFENITLALNELTFGETGNDVYKIELEAEGLTPLLLKYLQRLVDLQDTENTTIGKPKKIKIEKNKETLHQRLEAEIYMDKRTGGKYWPIKHIKTNHTQLDYQKRTGWTAETQLKFDTRNR